MKDLITQSGCSISRDVSQLPSGSVVAEFYVEIPGPELRACAAWIQPGEKYIRTVTAKLSAEQASAVQVAIGMAVEWLAEQPEVAA